MRQTVSDYDPFQSLARELFDQRCTGQKLKLRFKSNDSLSQILNLGLLRLDRFVLSSYLVLKLDHRGQSSPHALLTPIS